MTPLDKMMEKEYQNRVINDYFDCLRRFNESFDKMEEHILNERAAKFQEKADEIQKIRKIRYEYIRWLSDNSLIPPELAGLLIVEGKLQSDECQTRESIDFCRNSNAAFPRELFFDRLNHCEESYDLILGHNFPEQYRGLLDLIHQRYKNIFGMVTGGNTKIVI